MFLRPANSVLGRLPSIHQSSKKRVERKPGGRTNVRQVPKKLGLSVRGRRLVPIGPRQHQYSPARQRLPPLRPERKAWPSAPPSNIQGPIPTGEARSPCNPPACSGSPPAYCSQLHQHRTPWGQRQSPLRYAGAISIRRDRLALAAAHWEGPGPKPSDQRRNLGRREAIFLPASRGASPGLQSAGRNRK